MNVLLPSDIADKRPADSARRSSSLEFDPARDGFGFANVFTWTDEDLDSLTSELGAFARGAAVGLPALLGKELGGIRGFVAGIATGVALAASTGPQWLIRRIAQRWSTFGLCGGMALLSKERWERKDSEPTSALKRDDVRPILRLKQAQTIRASWRRFLKYWVQALASEGVFSPESLTEEAVRVRKEIDAGRPVLLGLVGDTPDPFAMHQVVAFGYSDLPAGVDISVYDPNGPGKTRHVVIHREANKMTIETDLPTGPQKGGGYHISKSTGVLSMVFVIDA